MTAARRTYVRQWDHEPLKERYKIQVTRGGKPVEGIRPERISYVEEEVMYWFKANHIHGWFVDNVQDGQDNCRTYDISPDTLRELLAVCEQVIEGSELVDGMVSMGTEWTKEHPKGREIREPGKVIDDPTIARRLLPTRSGFFFGSYEYNQYYLDEVVRTRDWLRQMIADDEAGVPGQIVYSSSW